MTNDCFCRRNAKVLIVSLKGIFCLNSPGLTNRDGNQNKTMNSPYSHLPFGCGGFIKNPPPVRIENAPACAPSPARHRNSFSSRERAQAVRLFSARNIWTSSRSQFVSSLCSWLVSCFSIELMTNYKLAHTVRWRASQTFCRQGPFLSVK